MILGDAFKFEKICAAARSAYCESSQLASLAASLKPRFALHPVVAVIDAAAAERREAEAAAEAQKKKANLEVSVRRLEQATACPRPALVTEYRMPSAVHSDSGVQRWLRSDEQGTHIWRCGGGIARARNFAGMVTRMAQWGSHLQAFADGTGMNAFVHIKKLGSNTNASSIAKYDQNVKQLQEMRSELETVVNNTKPTMLPYDVHANMHAGPMAKALPRHTFSPCANTHETSTWLGACCTHILDPLCLQRVAEGAMAEGVDGSVLISMSSDEITSVLFKNLTDVDDAKAQLAAALASRAVHVGVRSGAPGVGSSKPLQDFPETVELCRWLRLAVDSDDADDPESKDADLGPDEATTAASVPSSKLSVSSAHAIIAAMEEANADAAVMLSYGTASDEVDDKRRVAILELAALARQLDPADAATRRSIDRLDGLLRAATLVAARVAADEVVPFPPLGGLAWTAVAFGDTGTDVHCADVRI